MAEKTSCTEAKDACSGIPPELAEMTAAATTLVWLNLNVEKLSYNDLKTMQTNYQILEKFLKQVNENISTRLGELLRKDENVLTKVKDVEKTFQVFCSLRDCGTLKCPLTKEAFMTFISQNFN